MTTGFLSTSISVAKTEKLKSADLSNIEGGEFDEGLVSSTNTILHLLDDWLYFFDNVAFEDNQEWWAVIVCAIIGLSSLPKKEPGTAIRNVPRSTEQKPLTLFRPGVCKATWLIVMVKWSDGAIQMKRKPMIM